MSKKPLVAAAIAALLSPAVAACGDGEPEVEPSRFDLVIGDSIPLTGELSALGPSAQKAADLAVEEINDAIADAGVDHTVEIIHRDNGSEPETAATVAREMVDANDASCIAGAWGDADTLRTAEAVSIPDEVLQISPASTTDELTELDDGGLVDRATPPISNQGVALASAIEAALGGVEGRTVNVGVRSDAGQAAAEAFIEEWQERGGDVGAEVSYGPGQPDYAAEARELTEGEPEAYVLFDLPDTFESVAVALQATGRWDLGRTWGSSPLLEPELAADLGSIVDGMRVIAPGTPPDAPATRAFANVFRLSEPKEVSPQRFAAQQFDAVILCYLAAVAANSSDGLEMARRLIDNTAPGGEEFTWEELSGAIEALDAGGDIDYTGASGPVDLDENGDASAGSYDVYGYRDGTAEIVFQTPVPAVVE